MRFATMALILATALTACHGGTPDTPDDPQLVGMTGQLGTTLVPANTGGEMLAELRIVGHTIEGQGRPPLNLVVALDVSGSMRGDAIAQAKLATARLVSMVREGDFLSIVTFGSQAEVLLASTEVGEIDHESLALALDALEASGTTNMSNALSHADGQLRTHLTAETLDWVVLLGDGVPNQPERTLQVVNRLTQVRARVAALGFGLEYDEVLMGDIAQQTGGTFEFVEEPAQVAVVFEEQVQRIERLVARNATLSVQPGPGVELIEIVGHPSPGGAGGLQLSVGDLAEGETRSYVVRLSAPGRAAGAFVELIDGSFTFSDPTTNARFTRNVFLGAEASDSLEEITASRNGAVFDLATQMQAASNTIAAVRMLRSGNASGARALMESARSADGSYASMADSIEFSDDVVDGEMVEPSSAPVREAHDEAMQVLGY